MVAAMNYHNTVNLNGVDLEQRQTKVATEDQRILNYFIQLPNVARSACDAHKELGILLTNVRRAITNLTKAGQLRKTNEKKIGMYGHPVHLWVYESPKPIPLQLELMP